MEHGLKFFRTGEDKFKEEHGRSLGFTENSWGATTCHIMKSTKNLWDANWTAILGECSKYWCGVLATEGKSDGNMSDGGVDPHACIEIDW